MNRTPGERIIERPSEVPVLQKSLVCCLALLAAACGSPPPPATSAARIVTDEGWGIRYTVPEGWRSFADEIRSPGGSVWELKAESLEGAEKKFVAELPHSILPQLAGWTDYFYKRNGDPVLRDVLVGGHPGLEAVFPVLIRPADPPTAVAYWAVRHADTLYVFRVGFPPGQESVDLPAMRRMMESLEFLRPETAPAVGQVIQ